MTKKPYCLIPQILAAGLTVFGVAACSPVYFSQGLAGANQGDFKGDRADYNKKIDFNSNYAIARRSELEEEMYRLGNKEDWLTGFLRALDDSKLGFWIIILATVAGLGVYYDQEVGRANQGVLLAGSLGVL